MHARRRALAAQYTRLLGDAPELQLPVTRPEVDHGWHLYALRFRAEQLSIHRDAVIEKLTAAGIGTSVHFIPLHLHSYYRETMACRPEDFPVASAAAETILSLTSSGRLGADPLPEAVTRRACRENNPALNGQLTVLTYGDT
jgi:dTDP-4-amino-4,6-dideoxygalactose transaminase